MAENVAICASCLPPFFVSSFMSSRSVCRASFKQMKICTRRRSSRRRSSYSDTLEPQQSIGFCSALGRKGGGVATAAIDAPSRGRAVARPDSQARRWDAIDTVPGAAF
jgi:hypothetical protein